MMTTEHPQWTEFVGRLGRALNPQGNVEDGTFTWECDGTLAKASRILTDLGADVAASVQWLEDHGGYCDCEIMFNVAYRDELHHAA